MVPFNGCQFHPLGVKDGTLLKVMVGKGGPMTPSCREATGAAG